MQLGTRVGVIRRCVGGKELAGSGFGSMCSSEQDEKSTMKRSIHYRFGASPGGDRCFGHLPLISGGTENGIPLHHPKCTSLAGRTNSSYS